MLVQRRNINVHTCRACGKYLGKSPSVMVDLVHGSKMQEWVVDPHRLSRTSFES